MGLKHEVAYEKMITLDIDSLEELAYDYQSYALHAAKDLTNRYKYFQKAKRILKIADLICKERKSNEQ